MVRNNTMQEKTRDNEAYPYALIFRIRLDLFGEECNFNYKTRIAF